MTTVEVLAPLRLETRFVSPADRTDGVAQWLLRVRVYPDEFSVPRTVAPPSPDELDRLVEAVGSMSAVPPIDEAAAFARFAAAVGAGRGLGLWRRCVVADGAGGLTVDRTDQTEPSGPQVHGVVGLPTQLQVWFVLADGTRQPAATLALDVAGIAADLDITSFAGSAEVAAGTLPDTWWLSYRRAVEVGLAVDIDVGADPPALEALVVLGVGDTDAADLVDAHNAAAALAVLAPGTPTNTVEGEPTTDFGADADTVYPLLHLDPAAQESTGAALTALTGRLPADALPMLGGDLDLLGPGSLAVQGFWPVLWGRALRDVVTGDEPDIELARWARRYLAVEGPRPAIRIGEQPYGLLPTSAFTSWVADPDDSLTPVEDRILRWALAWCAGAAAAAESAHPWVDDADTDALLEVLGLHAPSRHWQVRPVADLVAVQVARIMAGMTPVTLTEWDADTAVSWRNWPAPAFPIAAAAHAGPVPGPPADAVDDPERLKELCTMEPEPLYFQRFDKLGLVGHLFRESLIAARAVVGEAITRWNDAGFVDLTQPLPLDDENAYRAYVMRGGQASVTQLETATDSNGALVAERFREVQKALVVVADLWADQHDALFGATLAALDTAAFRVDPWLTGLAERRLQGMITDRAPFLLGAYGWVDAPQPAAATGALAPGPTVAGLLHAPSRDQALTAALLRDAAVRHSADKRWDLTIDSAKVRDSIALAERVRLGLHPYEALGLEVEAVAGDWDVVRILRDNYALADGQDTRRVCDGAAVLAAARAGALVAGLPADLPDRLAPLDDVLDTYADLLMADGVHALVTGRADLANAAMEAAAGLGSPPELRAIRTPRAATTVRVGAWVLLPEGDVPPLTVGTAPADVADPAFAALVADELGADATTVDRQRLAGVLGGGDPHAPVPTLVGGSYDGRPATADDDLRAAMGADLDARLDRLRALTQTVHDAVAALDPDGAGSADEIAAVAGRWNVDLSSVAPDDPAAAAPATFDLQAALAAALADRLTASPAPPPGQTTDAALNLRRTALRALAGDAALPVLPVVAAELLPALHAAPDLDGVWLEIVAAVRPRLAALEAHQFGTPWPAALATPGGSTDPWLPAGPVLAAYGPAAVHPPARVAVAALDAWTDSVPGRRHTTAATFGFNAPKSRAPQAILLAVPPDLATRLDTAGLLEVVLQTRQLAHARAARPGDRGGLPYATPMPLVHASGPVSFLAGWPA